MARKVSFRAFNRGLISPLALARTDIERVQLSAEVMTNWMARDLGSMMLRPGTAYIGATKDNNAVKLVPFIFSSDDKALCEITDSVMRVWISDALVTRPTVGTSVVNGGFDSNVNNWIDNDDAGATSAWVTGGYLGLTGDGTNAAKRYQMIAVAPVSQNVEHALDININRGPVTLRVGSTQGDDDYISETDLGTGDHSLVLTPTGNFFVEFSSRTKGQKLVDSIAIGSSGTMEITAPWAAADLSKIRWDQSADVLYIAADGYQQYKIERRAARSWSVVKYEPEDGPFRAINTGPITITPSALTGNVTLTASASLFTSGNVGGLYRIASEGQTVSSSISAEDTFTNTIKVTGVTTGRIFTITRSGTWVATVTLQRSLTASDGPFEDVTTYTTNATITYDDSLDNQTAWYRIGIKTGDYTSGTAVLTLDYPTGSIEGIARITAFTSATSVSAEVLVDLGGTDATDDWYEGDWSTRRGFPTSVALVEGRLSWAGRDKVWLSVSDDYESFDDNVIGDSGPIRRTIGSGAVDNVNWLLALKRLVLSTDSGEWAIRSSSEDEILTPTNAMPKPFSTQGSATVNPVRIDASGAFVQRGGSRVYDVSLDGSFEYTSNDLSVLFPEVGNSKIVRMAVQRQPDTRLHCIRDDGLAMILVHDPAENVSCWLAVETGDGSEIVGSWGSLTTLNNVAGFDVDISIIATVGEEFTTSDDIDRFSISFSSDGTKMYLGTDALVKKITEFDLSTAWDITTATLNSNELDHSSELGSTATGQIEWNSTGTSIYLIPIVGADDTVYQYNLTAAWDISTASYASKSFDVSNETAGPASMAWGKSGQKFYVAGGTTVYEYDASTAYDISTLTYNSNNFTLESNTQGMGFSSSGTELLILGAGDDTVYQYSLSTAWDITSASYDGISIDFSTIGLNEGGDDMYVRPDLSEFYIVNAITPDNGQVTQFVTNATATDNSSTINSFSSTTASFTTTKIEDIAILPGDDGTTEDQVYYVVNRDISGATKRYIERWAKESECEGGTTNKCVDSHVVGSIADGVMTGLDHLNGKEVAVWANGKDLGLYTVASGQITGVLEDGSNATASNACAGIVYNARWKSAKLDPLTEKSTISRLGVVLRNTHYQGLQYGEDFSNLDPLPKVQDAATISDDTVHEVFEERDFSLDGTWNADSRLCLLGQSPRPVTILAAVITED